MLFTTDKPFGEQDVLQEFLNDAPDHLEEIAEEVAESHVDDKVKVLFKDRKTISSKTTRPLEDAGWFTVGHSRTSDGKNRFTFAKII